jgi:hypothetical protein
LVDSVRPILSGEVKQDQRALALPKVVSEHFKDSVAANYECTREAPLNVPGFVDRNDIVYGTNLYIGIGRGKELTHAASREQETAVVTGEAAHRIGTQSLLF